MLSSSVPVLAVFLVRLILPDDKKVVMLTKSDAESSDSFLAQGGICVLRDDE